MACTLYRDVAAEYHIFTDMTDISVQKYLQVGVKSLGEHVILQNKFLLVFLFFLDFFLIFFLFQIFSPVVLTPADL